MTALPLLWLFIGPALSAGLITSSLRLRMLYTRYWRAGFSLGVAGMLMLVLGCCLFDRSSLSLAGVLVGSPLVGLLFWIRRDSDDGDDGPEPDDPDQPQGPDWARFLDELEAWKRERRPEPVPA